jgi:hypothetical protein
MPAPIVIDVGIVDPQRELVTALVDACTQAATSAGTECRLVRDAPSGGYAAIAIVTWEEGDRARIEVGIRREPSSEWRTRELVFQGADAPIERYRSVGFVVGSLATAVHDDTATKAPVAEVAHPTPAVAGAARPDPKPLVAPKPVRAPAGEADPEAEPEPEPGPGSNRNVPRRGWVGIAGTIGGGLDRGSARLGGSLDVGVGVVKHLYVLLSAGASTRARDDSGVAPQWLDAGVGLGVQIGHPKSLHLDCTSQVIAEQFTAQARVGAERAENTRTTAGARFSAAGVLPLVAGFDFVLGGQLVFRPATRVHVTGLPDGSTRNAELGAFVGVRLEF